MNRTGLYIALGVTALFVIVYALFPQLDLVAARLFYDPVTKTFPASFNGTLIFLRHSAMVVAWLFAAPAIIALLAKLIWPRKPLMMSGRKAVFIVFTITVSAGILTNALFKQHWGRPRPAATAEFNGKWDFKPWHDSSGACPRNCSFFSGEAATAFWTYAPASLAPVTLRPVAYAAATVFGVATGVLRMSFGGHYLSDVIVAGIVAFLVIWLTHGLLFRWGATRFSDQNIDRWLTEKLLASRAWFANLWTRASDDFARPHDTGLPRAFWWLLAALIGLTAFRIVGLKLSAVDFFFDEAQYWAWAQSPAFGYFSKPPLLAWIVAGTQKVCGSGEACIRAASPVFYLGTSLVVYATALRLYGPRTAFWAGLCLALGTGVIFSSRIISTDVPLLFCWAVALYAYLRLLDERDWRWAVMLGVAAGFGMLAKYAMAYFAFSVLLAAWFDPRARDLLRHRLLWIAAAIAGLILLPNLVWVATHDFVTLKHTGDNIGGRDGIGFHPLNALTFLLSQFGVFGPIVFGVFLAALIRPMPVAPQPADRIMIAFALPPIVIVAVNGVFNHANANWAAPAAISVTILAVAILVRLDASRWLKATVAIGVAMQLLLPIADAFADRISIKYLAKPDVYSPTIGWRGLSEAVAQVAKANGAAAIVADQRYFTAALIYYTRKSGLPVYSWRTSPRLGHQFDIDRPLAPGAPEPMLYVTGCQTATRAATHYSRIEELPFISAPAGRRTSRILFAWKLTGGRGNAAPLDPCVR
ncbi:MAG: hypothetical protein A4S14_21160 [Proteobacteria bacterium SG_bin9]|nr:MAG: hypothetical protein A4S14_21160 [Proteobacteria bacterium SG_bin9]